MIIGRTLVTAHRQVGWSDTEMQDEVGFVFNIRTTHWMSRGGENFTGKLGQVQWSENEGSACFW